VFFDPTPTEKLIKFAGKYILVCSAISLPVLWALDGSENLSVPLVLACVFGFGLAAAIAGYVAMYALYGVVCVFRRAGRLVFRPRT
jgi:hypothetical protein